MSLFHYTFDLCGAEHSQNGLERTAGIEPASSAWKAEVLPLNYVRFLFGHKKQSAFMTTGRPLRSIQALLVQGGGFEPPKLARQIYSLIPLATREPLRIFSFFAS
jgi:hypothetical protein